MRRRLSYANVMATLAFFLALTGGAVAGAKYLTASDPITQGDLTGTYGNPLIGNGKVTGAKVLDGAITSSKIADGSITSSKFDSTATAPRASAIGPLDVITKTGSVSGIDLNYPSLGFAEVDLSCGSDRIAFDPQLTSSVGLDPKYYYTQQIGLREVDFHFQFGAFPNSASVSLACFGSG